ncbi:hypothetical protein AMJ87_07610 [candidate division WOR_3 bacterium SM23_60]|uniref:Uncharacterized protein n=1 Tax=candidate division WOR_3 bacterium SM23_60 TaxID=1703780 RepID=A0A0S8GEJ3_UNCW3|nr:MAG: hypothetical protein AMJ87_07610 [candidate division WOR_3 bacterium SM23_60]
MFDFFNDRHYAIFSPGVEKSIEEEYVGSWEIQLEFVEQWLKQLKKETSELDLWEEIVRQQAPSDFDFEADVLAKQFTPHQLANITDGLNQIRRYIQNDVTLLAEHHDMVMGRLDYLQQAAKRMNVKDWILVCIGMLFQTALQFAFSAQQTKKIFELLRNALQIVKECLPHIL